MSHPYNDTDQKQSFPVEEVIKQSEQQSKQDDFLQTPTFPINTIRLLSTGFIIWFLATLALRFFGQYIFKPNEPLLALALYLITSVAIVALALQIFAWQKLHHSQQFQAVVLLALPGMLLDSIIMVSFTTAFPNLAASTDSAVGSWLLWSYGLVLLAGFIRKNDL